MPTVSATVHLVNFEYNAQFDIFCKVCTIQMFYLGEHFTQLLEHYFAAVFNRSYFCRFQSYNGSTLSVSSTTHKYVMLVDLIV